MAEKPTRTRDGVLEHLCGACYDWKPADQFGRLAPRGGRSEARRSYCNECRRRGARLARAGDREAWL